MKRIQDRVGNFGKEWLLTH